MVKYPMKIQILNNINGLDGYYNKFQKNQFFFNFKLEIIIKKNENQTINSFIKMKIQFQLNDWL